MAKKDFTELKVWQIADQIFNMVIEDVKDFPRNRIALSLSDQLIRAVGSISANIAEGHGRGGDKELQRSLIIARGEISESRNWLIKVHRMGYSSDQRLGEYQEKFLILSKMMTLFIGEIRKRIKSSP
ncbi:MAG: four helix bundle protein [Patescibacteria group bacterium]